MALIWAVGCEPQQEPTPPPPQPPTVAPEPLAGSAPPELLAYPTPQPMGAEVRTKGRRVRARLSWKAIPGDHHYEVEVSRTLLFNRPVVSAEVRRPQYVARRLRPGAYFWRVRVVGELGEGRYSSAQRFEGVPEAASAGVGARTEHPAQPPALEAAPEPELFVPDTSELPLTLRWMSPPHRTVVRTAEVELVGRATPGARVTINDSPPVTVQGSFRIPFTLTHGRNELTVVAQLGEQRRSLNRHIYFADPQRLAGVKKKFEAIKAELDEVHEMRRELLTMMNDLRRQARAIQGEKGAGQIEAELAKIQATREQLDREVSRVITELDRLLGG